MGRASGYKRRILMTRRIISSYVFSFSLYSVVIYLVMMFFFNGVIKRSDLLKKTKKRSLKGLKGSDDPYTSNLERNRVRRECEKRG